MGSGVKSVFDGSPIKVDNVAGRLNIASSNIKANFGKVQQEVASRNAQGMQYARENKSQVIDKRV